MKYTKNQLLLKCNQDYPIGTKFKSAYNSERESEVEINNYYIELDSNNIFANDDNGECLYYNGIWAEIINKTIKYEIY